MYSTSPGHDSSRCGEKADDSSDGRGTRESSQPGKRRFKKVSLIMLPLHLGLTLLCESHLGLELGLDEKMERN